MQWVKQGELLKRIGLLEEAVHQKCVSAKSMVMDLVEEAFRALEADLRNTLARAHEESGLYDRRRCDKMEEGIAETLE